MTFWKTRKRGVGRWLAVALVALGSVFLMTTLLIAMLGGVALLALALLALFLIPVAALLAAMRSSIWLHVRVDSPDVGFSIGLPLPMPLLRWGLRWGGHRYPWMAIANELMADPAFASALNEQALEILVEDGADRIEIILGKRRQHWRWLQFNLKDTPFLQQIPALLEEKEHV